MIKNVYALTRQYELIHINDVDKNNKDIYYCCSCNDEMIARKGDVNTHHFAHKNELNCNYETYLHKTAKIKFLKEYNYCIETNKPFILEYNYIKKCNTCEKTEPLNSSCLLGRDISKFDLTLVFTKATEEKKYGNFIADILLESETSTELIFIEFAVTHMNEVEKNASNYRIVEIKLKTDEDLDFISNHKISVQQSNVTCHNFSEKPVIKNYYQIENCPRVFEVFFVYKNGKSVLIEESMEEIDRRIKMSDNIIYNKVSRDEILDLNSCKDDELPSTVRVEKPLNYINHVAKAASDGIFIKNCFICRYHAFNENSTDSNRLPIFCKFQKITADANYASECKFFKKESKYIEQYLDIENEVSQGMNSNAMRHFIFKDFLKI